MSVSSQRAKQVFVLPWPLEGLGGVNGVVQNLVREFAQSGPLSPVVIERAVGDAPSASEYAEVLRMILRSPYDPRHPLRALVSFCIRAPWMLLKLRAFCREQRVEVLNPHFVGLEHFCLVLLKRLGLFRGRVLLSFHGSDIRLMMQSGGLERWFSLLTVRWADYLIPCSEGLGSEVLMFAPESAKRIVPIQNGIDVDLFLRSSEAGFELPPPFSGRIRIVSIGAFEYKKGHNILLKAFSVLRHRNPLPALIIAGQTRSLFAETQLLVHELELQDDVLLYRDLPHDQAASLLRSCDVFVLSSRWEMGRYGEGFAMVLLEAAAAQKPVVSTLSCGVAEFIKDGETGWVVPPEDPAALAKAIQEALDSPEEARRRAHNLHELVRRDFTWKRAHARYVELTG
ncbi:MAG: glycosyltransferase family 4 protein [Acidobacteriota bacterium]|nr:glycosyltransferase family 4 protein [Acidobacteriota bacterium]